jgi:putative ABC transport system ATP-binding protein
MSPYADFIEARPNQSSPLIEIQDLSLSYPVEDGRLDVLRGVNLAINEGETVAILGPSGSGKTSLLLLLAGLEEAGAGRIVFDNADLDSLDADALADLRRDRLGIVFQSFHLVPMLPLEIAGRQRAREQALAMLDRVGLGGRTGHYPSQLSGGEQQRVAIARALVHQPRLLLADEPTGNLDAATGARIIELLFGLNRDSGSTMIVVTHDESVAARCGRVLRLRDGQLIEDTGHAVSA